MTHALIATLLPPGIVLAGFVLGLALRTAIGLTIRHPSDKLLFRPALAMLRLARDYVLIWCGLLGLAVAVTLLPISGDLAGWAQRAISATGYASVTFFCIAVAMWLVRGLGVRMAGFRPVSGMVERISQILLAVIGALLVLNALSVPITPLLTTLGVAGLATALALQDTLANFFAGFYLLADRPIQPGDYVQLDTGHEGYVQEVGWRSTRLRTGTNNVVIIPNERVSHAVITNYALPESRVGFGIKVSVSYDSDLDQVERVLQEIADAAVGEVPGLLADPPPVVRFTPGFGDSSLDLSLFCQVGRYVDQFLVQHELRKRILHRFRAEGIVFPFPTRTIELDADVRAWLHAQIGNGSRPGPR